MKYTHTEMETITVRHLKFSICNALPNHHAFWEFIYFIAGEAEFTCGTCVESVRPGDLCIISPGTLHLFKHKIIPGDRIVITVPANYINADYVPENARYFLASCPEWEKAFSGIMNLIENEKWTANSAHRKSEQSAAALILLVLSNFLQKNLPQFHCFLQNEVAFDLFRHITELATEEITMDKLAQKYFLSSSYLSRIFKNYCGTSPIDAVIQHRLANAAMELVETPQSIQQIARNWGYQSLTSFTKLFTRHNGCSPREYRKYYTALCQQQSAKIHVDSVRSLLPYK